MTNDESNSNDSKILIRAAWVATMDQDAFRDGGVVHRGGEIVAVGPFARVASDHPDAIIEDLGDVILLPGLVNPHTHLELSECDCGEPPAGSFTDWILSVRSRMKFDEADVAGSVASAVRKGVGQCLRFGVTSVGDITRQARWTRSALRELPLRCVSYGEVLGLAKLRHRYDELLAMAVDDSTASERVRIGLTPHAPCTVDLDGYRQCVARARSGGLPLATHLAETRDEAEFLARHAGPFRKMWEQLDLWTDSVPRFEGGPIRFAQAAGLLDYPALLAHVNYCDDPEMALLAAGRASVVYCPRTHAYFGHPPHRWRDMLAAGINVAIGTDSCASSPDLNLVEDLRLLHRLAPNMAAEQLWAMVTTQAARAINQSDRIGSIAPGKAADFVTFPAREAEPLKNILEEPILPQQVWIAGERIQAPYSGG